MKECIKCKIKKYLNEFWKKSKSKDWLQSICKVCKRDYNNNYYKNKSLEYKYNKKIVSNKRQKKILEYIFNIKLERWCIDCWYNKYAAALQFDHIHSKVSSISKMVKEWNSLNTILAEIEKCEVRCANCHHIRTSKQFGWYK